MGEKVCADKEAGKLLLNEKLNVIIANVVLDIHNQIHELAWEFELNEEQELRMFGFVIEKMRRANEYANKEIGIKNLNLE